jgi:Zn-dependent metalloprotease
MRIGSSAAAPAVVVPAVPPIEVWAPDPNGGLDQLVWRTGDPESADPIARQAAATGRRVLEYVRAEYGRSSFDGAGAPLRLRIHSIDPVTDDGNNALWYEDEQRIWLGDGDGTTFSPFGGGADVVAHELFHGVIDSEARMRYVGQEGALHESFADVLATGIDGNWQIGEDVYTPGVPGDALRDLSHPTWKNWRTFPAGEDEVHAMSEVPSYAAYLVGTKLGMGAMRRVWYAALTGQLHDHSGFAGARDATIAAARVLYGASSTQVQAVTDAWTAVGIDATTPNDSPD